MSRLFLLLAVVVAVFQCTLGDQDWNHGSAEYGGGGHQGQQIEYEYAQGHSSQSFGGHSGFASAAMAGSVGGGGMIAGGHGAQMGAAMGKGFVGPQEQEIVVAHGGGAPSGVSGSVGAFTGGLSHGFGGKGLVSGGGVSSGVSGSVGAFAGGLSHSFGGKGLVSGGGASSGASGSLGAIVGGLSHGFGGKGLISAHAGGFLGGQMGVGLGALSGSVGGGISGGGQGFGIGAGKSFAGHGLFGGQAQGQMASQAYYPIAFPAPNYPKFSPNYFQFASAPGPSFDVGVQASMPAPAPAQGPSFSKLGLGIQQPLSLAGLGAAVGFQQHGGLSGASYPKSEVIYQQQGPGIPLYGASFAKYGLSFPGSAQLSSGSFQQFSGPASASSGLSMGKPGSCPSNAGVAGICVYQCKSDLDCSGKKICCSTGCGTYCTRPARKNYY